MRKHTAKYLGRLKGKNIYRFPVQVILCNSRDHTTWGCEKEEWHQVIAPSAADAANYVRNLYHLRAETNVYAYGPKGGATYRYVGWESAIFDAMIEAPDPRNQLQLL